MVGYFNRYSGDINMIPSPQLARTHEGSTQTLGRQMLRCRLVRALALSCIAGIMLTSHAALAQRPDVPPLIKVVVPFAAGGGSDVIARAVSKQLAQRLGTSVIVENRPGGGGVVGATVVAKAPKDGSVLLFHSTSLVTGIATSKKPPFDVTTDLLPVAIVSEGPMLIGVSASSGFKTPQDLVNAARANPQAVTYGSPGIGSIGHLGVELLVDAANVQLRHIPYAGTAPALIDVAAGRVDMTIGSYSALVSQLSSGRVIPIAVTSAKPNPSYPDLPPMASAAPGYNANIWYALFAPAGVPKALMQRLNREASEAARSGEVQALLKPDGGAPVSGTLDELAQRVREDFAIWKRLATEKHITVE
ncbi:tripartite tricarboxylate transporter substrate-binding protein [Variovorax guangxiensis]|uniref:Bug family tripartite tricarboxylate transporter substrate binding protein n=1 Tax=Variovorax guangxiensis TaxID=1775474 RepID=UPI00286B50DC|nr:tripartite tricarboxylate transporter substrate-binding protein [Variovorax guangxiensis]